MTTAITYRTAFVPGQKDYIALLTNIIRKGIWSNYILYESKDAIRIALGSLAWLELSSDSLSLHYANQVQTEKTTDPFKHAGRLLDRLPVQDWTAYGYVAFDVAGYYLPYTKKIEEPLMVFLIPETELQLTKDGIWIRTTGDLDVIQSLVKEEVSVPAFEASHISIEGNRDWYEEQVALLRNNIQKGHLRKAILSRCVTVPGKLDVLGTYIVGARTNSRVRSYCFALGPVRGVGFSPETLLEAERSGCVLTNPLAGTRPRGETPEDDTLLFNELFADAKEVKEHAISIWLAQAEMASVCIPESVRIFDFLNVKKYRCVQHLSSQVSGKLQTDKSTWDALKELFPGITVSGVDKSAALAWINHLEEEPRGIYAGAVGWIDAYGSADFAIAIRSVYQYQERICLNAGAGIVAESDPQKEYIESVNKMNTMLQTLVLEREIPFIGGEEE
jgi:salicylate synthetase